MTGCNKDDAPSPSCLVGEEIAKEKMILITDGACQATAKTCMVIYHTSRARCAKSRGAILFNRSQWIAKNEFKVVIFQVEQLYVYK